MTSLTVVAKPLLKYTSVGFQEASTVKDIWNESFEGSLTAKNHYWYGRSLGVAGGSAERNNTLDSGFEEVSSSSLNPYVNLPSWFLYQDSSDITIMARRVSNVHYDQSYSASVETKYIKVSTNFVWQTPSAIHSSCGYTGSPPSNTIDDNTATEWKHDVIESHWVIYDLGQAYYVKKIRVYCGVNRLDDVCVYVSNDPQNFGSPVIDFWDPPSQGWNESPAFFKKGRYIKLVFGTTLKEDKIDRAFYEFDAYVDASEAGHVSGGLQVPNEYFVKKQVYLSNNPSMASALFLDDAGPGTGLCEAYYLLVDVEIQNGTSTLHIVYTAPVTTLGSPSSGHFSNTTTVKYIYGVATINQWDVWKTFTRNIRSDYQSIWGPVYNATIGRVTIKNDFFNPKVNSETDTPFMKTNYDAVSIKLLSYGNEEELVNGSFEAPGWVKVQEWKLAVFNYTKDSSDSKQGATSFFMNVTGDTSGGSGSGFNATKHG